MKEILMIHEIHESMFKLDLERYILTFDDGLATQFRYFDSHFRLINTEKIFFISTGIICLDGKQDLDYITCVDAHKKAFSGNFENYMTLEQIQYLKHQPNVSIGGHGHGHRRLNLFDSLMDKVCYIKQDTAKMISWFNLNLEQSPKKFCFPYNEDPSGIYSALIKKYGIKELYGNTRLPIETVMST